MKSKFFFHFNFFRSAESNFQRENSVDRKVRIKPKRKSEQKREEKKNKPKMPVTASNENMEVDSDNNLGEGSSSSTINKTSTNTQPSTSSGSSSKSANDIGGSSVMASPATVPSVTVSLHPLVIMNISEHWTRIRAQNGSPQQGTMREHYFDNFLLKIKMSVL